MHREAVKNIVRYYGEIPKMLEWEKRELDELEDRYYNGIKSIGGDGMPHGTTTGNPTESMGMKAADQGASVRAEKIRVKIRSLEADSDSIEGCIEGMNSKYKTLLVWRLVYKYNWVQISTRFARPESTCRYWYDEALEKLGKILENDVLMADELEERASRAR